MAQQDYRRFCNRYGLLLVCLMSVGSFLMFLYSTNQHTQENMDSVLKFESLGKKPHSKSRVFSDNLPGSKRGSAKDHESLKHVPVNKEGNDQQNDYKPGVNNIHGVNSVVKTLNALDKVSGLSKALNKTSALLEPSVHVFYYPWYKSPAVDGQWQHWNHQLLPHWTDKSKQRKRQHQPPGDIGANFYPALGPYSSTDRMTIHTHMHTIAQAGVGVVSVSWYPPQHEKPDELSVDALIPLYLDAAHVYGIKIALHIEPYANRSGETLREVLQYVIAKYGDHPAFYRTEHKGRRLPLVYVYDSYQIEAKLWAQALTVNGSYSIRNTPYDAVVIGLMVDRGHMDHIQASGFDGFYTYFASNGFAYASTWKNWPLIAKRAKDRGLIFIPSIGPGYIDTEVRPWNGKNTKKRLRGRYYKEAFKSAMNVKPEFLSITSFNEWHEGTQIEAAVPMTYNGYKYMDYKPDSPGYYMNLTSQFVQQFHANRSRVIQTHNHEDI